MYDEMTDAEFAIECADEVQEMAMNIATIARQTAMLLRHDKGERSNWKAGAILCGSFSIMLNGLGDILNGMDAVEQQSPEKQEQTGALFDELRRRVDLRSLRAEAAKE